jgi:hypothetical protein
VHSTKHTPGGAARGESASEGEDEQKVRVRGGATKQYPQRYERVAPTKKSAFLLVRGPNGFRNGLVGPETEITGPAKEVRGSRAGFGNNSKTFEMALEASGVDRGRLTSPSMDSDGSCGVSATRERRAA